ncbi:hypothetical protein EYF80_048510 [Liparis tanakae]|uniref:Uncharacterized protein n=1 Tax=Liparis tanakae TaxID=230148 RepID=A0A4Z2FJG4_9TELE|nr:hypothetical protein EYF80_048510 [Liparis tanakae]
MMLLWPKVKISLTALACGDTSEGGSANNGAARYFCIRAAPAMTNRSFWEEEAFACLHYSEQQPAFCTEAAEAAVTLAHARRSGGGVQSRPLVTTALDFVTGEASAFTPAERAARRVGERVDDDTEDEVEDDDDDHEEEEHVDVSDTSSAPEAVTQHRDDAHEQRVARALLVLDDHGRRLGGERRCGETHRHTATRSLSVSCIATTEYRRRYAHIHEEERPRR